MKARATVVAGIVAAAALLAGYLATWAHVNDFRQSGSDFSASYTAALLIREGHAAALYDQGLEQARHLAFLPSGTRLTLPFITPPTTALLALPFTALDPATASRAFALVELAVLALAVTVVVRAAPWPQSLPRGARLAVGAVALAGVPTLSMLLLAQLDALCALGLAGGYALWRRGRPGAAGFCLALGFAAAKPHLAVGLLVYLLARRDWRALAGAAGAVALAAAAAAAAAGPGSVIAFIGNLGYSLRVTAAPSTVGLPGL
ncbi:MAG TPA: glycosyltransferase family 87 protein, partial [Candidatus Dormibacteraeota bacterium]|nr:glycosyltransferase family 87 protein [Candidatus Dormibacteraeota bacterium]